MAVRSCQLSLLSKLSNRKKIGNTMKYAKPEFEIFEVAVEGGYGNSSMLPGFGSEEDDLTY